MLARMRGDCNEYERALHERGSAARSIVRDDAARSATRWATPGRRPRARVACSRGWGRAPRRSTR